MIVKIPFRVVELEPRSYHIVVDGEVGDVASTFIVDTGASRTIIDNCYVENLEKLEVELENPMATGISAEQIPVELYNIPLLTLSGVELKDINALATDLAGVNEVYSKITGGHIAGLIGCDFLLEKRGRIDFVRKEIVLKINQRLVKSKKCK